jgi:hypothetical protein
MSEQTKEQPSFRWRSIDEAPAYLRSVMAQGMEAQLSPLPSDHQSTKTEQTPPISPLSIKD